VNKSRTGCVSMSEWGSLVEALSSRRGKMRVLYGMCGDRGEPQRVAEVLRLICRFVHPAKSVGTGLEMCLEVSWNWLGMCFEVWAIPWSWNGL
jgi:hypothetical protein